MAIIEICTFRPSATGTAADDALRAADARMQTDFAYQQPGLRRRTTGRDDEGRWCVVTLWATADDAAAADAAGQTDDVARQYWSLIDPDSVSVQRFTML